MLDDVPFFDLITMAPQDVMHVILEGGLAHETRLFIEHCVAMQYFTLDQLNTAIQDFDYGYAERSNRPSVITVAHIQAPVTTLGNQKGAPFSLSEYNLLSRFNILDDLMFFRGWCSKKKKKLLCVC